MKTVMEQMEICFRLEQALHTQTEALGKAEAQLPLARHNLRQTEEKQLLYPGSLACLADRFTGKAAEKREALDRQVRHEKAALENLEALRASLLRDIQELNRERAQYPAWDSFCTGETRRPWAVLERKLCAEALLPLLEKTAAALEDYSRQLQGDISGPGEHHERATNHIAAAESCAPWLARLKKAMEILEETFAPGAYLENPGAFIDGAVARHNRIDRAGRALEQLQALQKYLKT